VLQYSENDRNGLNTPYFPARLVNWLRSVRQAVTDQTDNYLQTHEFTVFHYILVLAVQHFNKQVNSTGHTQLLISWVYVSHNYTMLYCIVYRVYQNSPWCPCMRLRLWPWPRPWPRCSWTFAACRQPTSSEPRCAISLSASVTAHRSTTVSRPRPATARPWPAVWWPRSAVTWPGSRPVWRAGVTPAAAATAWTSPRSYVGNTFSQPVRPSSNNTHLSASNSHCSCCYIAATRGGSLA